MATTNKIQNGCFSPLFASANFYGKRDRHPMDDLESLVYSMWYIADVPMIRHLEEGEAEGALLNKCNKDQAEARVLVNKNPLNNLNCG